MKVVHCTWKLLFDGERNQTFDSKRFKYIKGNISDGGNMQIFSSWVGFSSIPRVSHKGSGGGWTVHTWWVQQYFDIFGKKGDTCRMILRYNPAGHYFVLRDLALIELFQISHNCVMNAAGKIFVKTCLKSY